MDKAVQANRLSRLVDVCDQIDLLLAPEFAPHGFRFRRRDATYHREQNGVALSFALGISSRPPSIGGVGILIEPHLVAAVNAWMADAERRLASSSGPVLRWEHPSPVVWELLDWLVPGNSPHWTLPDDPEQAEVEDIAKLLRDSVVEVGLPFMERLATTELLLNGVVGGELRVLDDARFTIACGALLAGRLDLARTALEPLGTARRESAASVLGLPA